jgi:hypothetical protein
MWRCVDIAWTDVSEELIASISRVENTRARSQREQVFFYACVFIAAVTILSNRCLATFVELHIGTGWWEGFLSTPLLDSDVVMFIPGLILYGFSHWKVHQENTQTRCMITAKKTNCVHTWHLKVYHRSKIVSIRTVPRNGTAVFLKTSLNDFG